MAEEVIGMVIASHHTFSTRDRNEGEGRTVEHEPDVVFQRVVLPAPTKLWRASRLTVALFTAAHSRLGIGEEKARMTDGGTMAG